MADTIQFSIGNTTPLQGPRGARGNGIESYVLVSGDHSPGSTDLYRVTMTDGETTDVPVYNGTDVSDIRDAAEEARDEAAQSKEDAEEWAAEAAGYKEQAASSAEDAAGSASSSAESAAAAAVSEQTARLFLGAPLVAAAAADMTDEDRVYVYVGSETGYTVGNWYYYDGSAWTSGGVYQAGAVQTDTTLAVSGAAADAKVTGDELNLCLRAVGSIASTDDLDLFKNTSGMYYCSSDVSALASHTPWDNKAFALFVKSGTTPAATSGQAQFAINSRGEFACRFYVGGVWSAWKFYNTSDDIDSMMALTMVARESITSTDDLDLFKSTSGMYYCSAANAALASHVPWNNKAFALFVKSGTLAAATAGQAQFAISWSGEFACRFHVGGAWGAWKFYNTSDDIDSMMALAMVARESITSTDDLDLFKSTSGMYYCSAANAALASHVPWNNKAFALFVKSGTLAAATSGQAQYAISWSGEIASRFYVANAWSAWRYAADVESVGSTFVEMDLSLFSRIAVCGGSYDSGYSYNSAGTGVTNYSNAWLKILSRKHGFIGNVYAAHGTSIDEWFDPSYSQASHCYAAFAEDTASQLYITTFGANDTISGSTADCAAFDADPTLTPTTFYGWYAKLIYTIRQKAAADGVDTRIILTTPSSEGIISSMESRITAINEIAAYYGFPVMRWTNDPILSANLETFTSAGSGTNKHPTPYGYAIMASAFERLFGKCAASNASYFNDWRN